MSDYKLSQIIGAFNLSIAAALIKIENFIRRGDTKFLGIMAIGILIYFYMKFNYRNPVEVLEVIETACMFVGLMAGIIAYIVDRKPRMNMGRLLLIMMLSVLYVVPGLFFGSVLLSVF